MVYLPVPKAKKPAAAGDREPVITPELTGNLSELIRRCRNNQSALVYTLSRAQIR